MSRPTSKDGKDGEDLNSILNDAQRAEVTLLVANCTEATRNILLQNFDADAGMDRKLFTKGGSDEEKFMSTDPSTADVEAYDKERKLKEECEKDINSKESQKLKKEALKAYDEWREQVMMRVGEVVNTKSDAKKQLEEEKEPMSPKPKAPITTGKIADVPDRNPNLKFKDLFPPTKTPLTKLPMEKRTLVLHSLLLLLISLEHYNAYSRILMLNLTSSLKLPLRTFEQDEYTTAKGLLESAKELSADEETQKRQKENADNRKRKVYLATAAGAAILGVSGGLAAPLVASGVGSMMDKYAREVEDFEFLPVHSDKKTSEDEEQGAQEASEHDHKLRVTICISGWLTDKSEVTKPWRVMGTGAEVFGLKWELEALLNLGHAMDGMMQSAAWGYAQREIIKRTIFAELMSALWPMGLLKVARVIDNPFSVAKARADKAGEVLADALINKAQGERPVTLIGYSLGARLIYTCLKTLAERKAFGLVENAVIIGGPCPSDTQHWRVLRTAVSGRLINVYSQNDYLLGFMYRTSALQYGVAGLQPIRGLAGIENVDVSEDVDGHTRYRFLVGGILKKIGFEDIDLQAVQEEREALEKMLKQEKKNSLQSQRKRLMRRESYKGEKIDEDEEAEVEASDMEKQVRDKTEKSLTARLIEWWYTPGPANAKDAEKAGQTLQKAVQNPSDAKAAAGDTVKDVQASAQSYASWAASKLPSMPGGSSNTPKTDKANKQATDTADNATSASTGYIQAAQEYLPNMPSMPSFRSKTDAKGKDNSANTTTEKAADFAKQATDTQTEGTEKAINTAQNVVQPTVNNVLNPKDNPAVKAAKNVPKNAPIIHQAADRVPGANKAAQVTSDTVGTTVQNSAQQVSTVVNSSTSKAADAGKAAAKVRGEGVKRSVSFGKDVADGAAQQGSKAADVGSSAVKSASEGAGKLGKAGQGAADSAKSQASKLTDTGAGAAKSASDGATKAAGAGQDAANALTANASKAANAGKSTSEGVTKTASDGAGKVTSVGQGAANALTSNAGKAASAGKDTTKGITGGLGKMASSGQEAVKSPSTAPKQAANAGQTATNAASSGANTLAGAGKSLFGGSSKPNTPSAGATEGVKSPKPAATPSKEAVKSPKTPSTPKQQAPQQAQEKAQSYFGMASSYMPSLPGSGKKQPQQPATATKETPASKPNNTNTESKSTDDKPKERRKPPKLGAKRTSETPTPKQSTPKPSTPSTTQAGTTQTSTPSRPKPASRTPSGVKSPPKLDNSRRSSASAAKSPPPKLSRQASGQNAKSPPPKLNRQSSSSAGQHAPKSPVTKLDRQTSGLRNQVSNAGQAATSAVGSIGGRLGGLTGGWGGKGK
ncbi:uncharacterized protein AB675_10814 [Cyphellophora attinorum]|uniref:Putative membrane protein n=1 Tax=Cyphellophora attinorum TaxID=1664694 RepID=A0A0N1NZQ0_9EURO|nr:uncharacterized protein AB675_10814 [Phialophora attinorum]KPI40680.1 putative membrane protein [Phialophora attinorum]